MVVDHTKIQVSPSKHQVAGKMQHPKGVIYRLPLVTLAMMNDGFATLDMADVMCVMLPHQVG